VNERRSATGWGSQATRGRKGVRAGGPLQEKPINEVVGGTERHAWGESARKRARPVDSAEQAGRVNGNADGHAR